MTLTQINKAGLDEIALDHVFTIGASGSSAYTFQGEGLNGTVNNPTLYLTRGKTYRFENGSGGHPIRIQSTSGASGTAYNTGVTNNAGSGTVIVEVQHDAPDVLYYQCTSHAAMNGILYITGALADGGVTTAKIADDAVTDAKLANSINSAIAANTAKTSNATHTGDVTGSTSLTIASGAVTTAKIADANVTTAKIADDAVTVDKIQNFGQNQIAGRTASGTGSLQGLSASDVRTMINVADGATNSTSTTINNNADNRVITGSGTANTLEGESNLTFTSNVLKVQNGVSDANDSNLLHAVAGGTATRGIMLGTGRATGASQNDGMGYIDAIDSDSNNYGAQLQFRIGGTRVMVIGYNSNDNVGIGNDYPLKKLTVQADQNTHGIFLTQSNDYDSGWGFHADDTSGALKIDRSINNNFGYRRATFDQDGGLCFGSDTAAANALSDYEEGVYSPNLYRTSSNVTFVRKKGRYIVVGNLCFVWFDIQTSSNNSSGSGTWRISLPFTFANNSSGSAGLDNAGHGAPSFRDMSFFTRDQGYKTSSYINGNYIDLRYINNSDAETNMIENGSAGRVTGQAWGYLSQAT